MEEVPVCVISNNKPYMDYRMVTDVTSNQYQYIQANLERIDAGLLIFDKEYVGVALGSIYGEIGTKYIITTDTGNVFKVVKIDEKSDKHTTNGCQDASGAIIEFVVDTEKMNSDVMLYGNYDVDSRFNGIIIKIEMEK